MKEIKNYSPKILSNLFNLSKEQEDLSRMIYNGKIVKCLVAPYHTYDQLEKIIPFTKTTYLFPEREVPIDKLKSIISSIAGSPSNDEFRIVTTNQNIIMDMIDGCVRVLTEMGEIVPSPCKTFAANIHDIRYDLLENEVHQIPKDEKDHYRDQINAIIEQINKAKSISVAESKILLKKIELIAEPLIRNSLMDMLESKIR